MTTFIRLTNIKPGIFLILGFLFTIVTILPTAVNAQDPFITTWKTDNPGSSADNQITIPTASGSYNYDVYWEDETDATVNGTVMGATGDVTITFPATGTYRVEISGDFPRIYFNDGGDKEKIRSIEQWGDIAWTSMFSAFYGASNLTLNATDAPNLSNVTSLGGMFFNALLVNADLNHWDVSNVTDMARMFRGADAFNGDISRWNLSNVDRIQEMFTFASTFDQDIGSWDVSNVTDMEGLFRGATSFNQDISEWNTTNVTNMSSMFSDAVLFNQDISTKTINAGTSDEYVAWDVSGVTSMERMLSGARSFNQDISSWDVSGVRNMEGMFEITDVFNQDIGGWNVSNVTNMHYMFQSASVFNQDISGWNVSNVTNMHGTFFGATAFNQDISSWDVSNVTTMWEMFWVARAFDQDLGGWDITSVTNMEQMLNGSGLSIENYDATLIGWAGQSVQPRITLDADGLEFCDGAGARQSLIAAPNNWIFNGDMQAPECGAFITTWNTSNAGVSFDDEIFIPTVGSGYNYNVYWEDETDADINGTRSGVTGHLTLEFPSIGTYRVYITGDFPGIHFNGGGDKEKILSIDQWGAIEWGFMDGSFSGASNLVVNAPDAPDLTAVTSLERMFWDASSMNSNLNHWDVSGITNMGFMFNGATAFNGDISGWDVSGVENMELMFTDATAFNQDLGSWDVSSVTSMLSMFSNASAFNQDIGGWDVSNVTAMRQMFRDASAFDQDISTWDISGVTDTRWMFQDASAFDQDLGGWNVGNVTHMTDMLRNSGLSTANYDATLIGWAAQTVQSGVSLGAEGLEYCAGETARQTLTDSPNNWTITDDGLAAGCDPYVLLTGAPGWRMLSSPVEVSLADLLDPIWTQGASATSGADHSGGAPNVLVWDNTSTDGDPTNWQPVTDLSATASAGTGVLVYVFNEDEYGVPASAGFPKSLSVSGTVNSLPLSLTAADLNPNPDGWTLLGNPVNTGIDWDNFSRTDVNDVVYVWDPNKGTSGDWVSWNGMGAGDLTNGVIHPFQGFFVQTSLGASSPSLTIPASATSSPDDFFGKEADEEPLVVRLHMEEETGLESTAWLQFSGQGSLEANRSDAVKLQPLAADYAVLGLEPPTDDGPSLLALKHLPLEMNAPLEILLTATATQGGSFTLGATRMNLPDGWSLSLQDTRTGEEISVERGMEYTFKLEANEQLQKTSEAEGGIPLTPRPLTQPSDRSKRSDGSEPRFLLTITPAGAIEADLPEQIALEQNYPNPFNPSTVISYQLPAVSQVRLEVYDMVGRRVAMLVDGQVAAGAHQVNFDGRNLSSGVYLYRLQVLSSLGEGGQTADAVFTKKLTLIK